MLRVCVCLHVCNISALYSLDWWSHSCKVVAIVIIRNTVRTKYAFRIHFAPSYISFLPFNYLHRFGSFEICFVYRRGLFFCCYVWADDGVRDSEMNKGDITMSAIDVLYCVACGCVFKKSVHGSSIAQDMDTGCECRCSLWYVSMGVKILEPIFIFYLFFLNVPIR